MKPTYEELEKRNQALEQNEKYYRLLINNSTDMISTHDDQGVYKYATPICLKLIGYHPNKLVGKNAYDYIHPDDQETVNESQQKITNEGIVNTVSYRIKHKIGFYIWAETTSKIVRDETTNEFHEIIAITRDITERKDAEIGREKILKQLRESLESVKTLRGLLPICCNCKKIRDDRGYWKKIEEYIQEHSEARFSHGICRECANKLYPDLDISEK